MKEEGIRSQRSPSELKTEELNASNNISESPAISKPSIQAEDRGAVTLDFSQYCFTRNKGLLQAELVAPIAVRINVRTFSNNEFLPPSTDESATRLYPLPTNQ
jgi:hypothetical protein